MWYKGNSPFKYSLTKLKVGEVTFSSILLKDLMNEASKHFERKSILHTLKYLNKRD